MALWHLFLTLYWWEWLAYLFAFCEAIFLAILLTRSNSKSNTQNSGENTGNVTAIAPMRTLASKWLAVAVFSGACFVSGYGVRDHQLISRTITYRNVFIQQKVADRSFFVIPQWMSRQEVDLCKVSTVDWKEGDTLDDWTFEQQHGCKRVISYHKHIQGELDASISLR